MKRLASWNVNGIRAVAGKGFIEWLTSGELDIVCLQETKAMKEQLPVELVERDDFYIWYASAEKKGYSGVALFSSKKIERPEVTIGLGIPEYDIEGRTIIAHYSDFILINCYFPNGRDDLSRVPYKLAFSRAVAKHALALQKKHKKGVAICGDYNTAHTAIDLANPKQNEKNTGFLPEERAWIDEFMAQGFHDVFRETHPDEPKHYTWWSYRQQARDRNVGWRIDYFFVDDLLLPRVKMAFNSPDQMGSDHCPVNLHLL